MISTQQSLFAPVLHVVPIEVLESALRAPVIAVDCETVTDHNTGIALGVPGVPTKDYGLSYNAPVSMISLAWQDEGEIATAVLQAPFSTEAIYFIQQVMSRENPVVAHNAIFDMRQISKYSTGFTPDYVWCTATMARLLSPEVGKFDLLSVADAYGIQYPAFMKEMKGKRANIHLVDETQVYDYAAADAKLALELYQHQIGLVNTDSLFMLVDWETRAVTEYSRMTARGVRLNQPYVEQRITELAALRKQMWKQLADDGLSNPGSPKQRAKYIYQVKGIPLPAYEPMSPLFTDAGAKRAANGEPVTLDDLSTSGDALATISESSPENNQALKLLSDYQGVDRMLATFESLQDHAATDGRVHSLISIATTTGRRTSTHPNLQNLKTVSEPDDPSGDMTGVFIGDDDQHTLVEVDYSNAENWIAAMLAGDDALAEACNAEDFHSAMAERYFGDQWQQADKDQRKHLRRMGKSITFGTAYGMGKTKLALTLGIAESEAQALLDAKDRVFWGVADAKRMAVDKATREGWINLWTGRRVLVDPNATYTAWNYLCQGAVGEMVKRSIVLISDAYRENNMQSRIALDEHDALILSVHHDEWESALGIASEVMESVIPSELNERTNPPIRWIARPDLDQNRKKWGRFQYHWGDTESEALAALVDGDQEFIHDAQVVQMMQDAGKTKPAVEITIPDLQLDDNTVPPVQRIEVPSLGWRWQGRVRLNIAPKYWNTGEKVEVVRMLIDLLMNVDHRQRQEFEVVLPVKTAVGIDKGDPITVHRTERWKIAAVWAQVAAQGIDTEAILGEGMTAEGLEALAKERKQEADSLDQVVERCIEAIDRLEGQLGVNFNGSLDPMEVPF